ncbi:MAG: hypothetical protein ACOC6C_01620 [Verrucomicrobiota bacterium]
MQRIERKPNVSLFLVLVGLTAIALAICGCTQPGRTPSGAIYRGFFWEAPVPEEQTTLHELSVSELEQIRELLPSNLDTLSSHGWNPGIPDRTLTMQPESIRIVYGGSMGDEFGVAGAKQGHFRSERLLDYLQDLEQRKFQHAKTGISFTAPQGWDLIRYRSGRSSLPSADSAERSQYVTRGTEETIVERVFSLRNAEQNAAINLVAIWYEETPSSKEMLQYETLRAIKQAARVVGITAEILKGPTPDEINGAPFSCFDVRLSQNGHQKLQRTYNADIGEDWLDIQIMAPSERTIDKMHNILQLSCLPGCHFILAERAS